MPRAAGLADELRQEFGLESKLIKGQGGVFVVTLDGEQIFSKKAVGRHAEPGEVASLVRARLS